MPLLRAAVSAPLLALLLVSCDDAPATDAGGLDAGSAADAGVCDIDVSSDPNHCGACGRVCPHVAAATTSCVAGACVYTCVGGFEDCDGDLASPASNGCEVDTEGDAAHCGACGNQCPGGAAPRSAGACVEAECAVGCEAGWADCNNDLFMPGTDGCEAELATDASHCGSCRNACGGACEAGVCEGTTPACRYFTDTLVHPVAIRLAAGDGGVLAVWNDLRLRQLFFERLGPEGQSTGAAVLVDGFRQSWRFDVGWDGARYVVVHEDRDASVARATFIGADGAVLGPSETLPGDGAGHIAVASAEGGVAAVLEDRIAWIHAGGVEIGAAPGFGARAARTADGFATLGARTLPPTPERPIEVLTLETAALDSTLATRSGPAPLGSGILAGGLSTALASFGSGALAVASLGVDDFGPFTLQHVRFDARGEPTSPPSPIAGSPSVTGFDLDSDDAGAWLAFGGQGSFDPTVMHAIRADASGAFGAAVPLADVRSGFLRSVSVAATDTGALVVWVWRAFSGGPDLHAIEGAFVRRDGTVVRPCE